MLEVAVRFRDSTCPARRLLALHYRGAYTIWVCDFLQGKGSSGTLCGEEWERGVAVLTGRHVISGGPARKK